MQQAAPELNMTRAVMNTMIQWFIDMDMPRRILLVADARMFDVGIMEPEVNGLYQIKLNIAANATKNFSYNEETFSFNCGYNRQDVFVEVPYAAVLGFIAPTSESTQSFLPIPNIERELLGIQLREELQDFMTQSGIQGPQGLMEGEESGMQPLPDGAYAVHGVEPLTHDEDGNQLPTVQELMKRKPLAQRPAAPAPKEQPKPLLDFGNVGGFSLPAPRQRRVCPPHLRVIQGGKA
ncbi:hypothetical protein [Pseudomonas phage D6]|nr:hypothetical protein [Pseudomonas phage D6]